MASWTIMLKTVQNSRDHKEQRKFKYTGVGSYLPLSLTVSSNFSVLLSSELLPSLVIILHVFSLFQSSFMFSSNIIENNR